MDKIKGIKLKIDKKSVLNFIDRSKVIVISVLVLGLFSYPLLLVLGFGKDESNDTAAVKKVVFDKEEIESIESRQSYQPLFSDDADHSPNPFSEE